MEVITYLTVMTLNETKSIPNPNVLDVVNWAGLGADPGLLTVANWACALTILAGSLSIIYWS